MTLKGANIRTVVLGAIAALLVGATLYDYTVGIGGRGAEPGAETPPEEIAPGRLASLAREVAELRHFLSHAPQVRARYQAIATPYAEAVATFSTLYAQGEVPASVAGRRLADLLAPPIQLGDVLVSEANPSERGALWLTATLDFSSNDSEAFEKALLTLGDASNGTVWKELAVTGDPEHRTLRASGQLTLLMVEQAE